MTTSPDRGSAKIYEFPKRGRFASAEPAATADRAHTRAAVMAIGDAWYHDEAIDADRNRRN